MATRMGGELQVVVSGERERPLYVARRHTLRDRRSVQGVHRVVQVASSGVAGIAGEQYSSVERVRQAVPVRGLVGVRRGGARRGSGVRAGGSAADGDVAGHEGGPGHRGAA